MSISASTFTRFSAVILSFAGSSVFAAEQGPAQSQTGYYWHAMHWPAYWCIFPLVFFALMGVICIYASRKGSSYWRWRCLPRMAGSRCDDTLRKSRSESFESAIEMLNKRLVKGDIDKQEYKEIKAVIVSSE